MKLLFLSLFALLVSLTACCQVERNTIEVIYTKAYKSVMNSSDNPPRLLEDQKFRLFCNPVASRFETIRSTMIGDDNTIRYKVEQFARFLYRDNSHGITYKNRQERRKLYQTEIADNIFLVKEKYNQYKWKLKNDRKKILGYRCYKAVGSYREYNHIFKRVVTINVTAWYAPGVPFSFGPSGYDGLPGLVLEASRGQFHFIATKITFSPKETMVMPPDKGIEVSRKEFNDVIYEIYQKHTRKH